MTHERDRPQRSPGDRAVAIVEPWGEAPAERVVGDGSCQLADAWLRAKTLTIDAAQHNSAGADLPLGCQLDVGQSPRHSFSGVARSEEIRIPLQKRERVFDRRRLASGKTLAKRDNPRVNAEPLVVALVVLVSPSHHFSLNDESRFRASGPRTASCHAQHA